MIYHSGRMRQLTVCLICLMLLSLYTLKMLLGGLGIVEGNSGLQKEIEQLVQNLPTEEVIAEISDYVESGGLLKLGTLADSGGEDPEAWQQFEQWLEGFSVQLLNWEQAGFWQHAAISGNLTTVELNLLMQKLLSVEGAGYHLIGMEMDWTEQPQMVRFVAHFSRRIRRYGREFVLPGIVDQAEEVSISSAIQWPHLKGLHWQMERWQYGGHVTTKDGGVVVELYDMKLQTWLRLKVGEHKIGAPIYLIRWVQDIRGRSHVVFQDVADGHVGRLTNQTIYSRRVSAELVHNGLSYFVSNDEQIIHQGESYQVKITPASCGYHRVTWTRDGKEFFIGEARCAQPDPRAYWKTLIQ